MARPETTSATSKLLMLVTLVVVVAGLRLAQEVLIPLALAILVSFLLAPLVRRLERVGFWRVPAVLLVTAMAFLLVVALGSVLAGQLVELTDRLPQYRSTIHNRIVTIRSGAGGIFGRASQNIQEIGRELSTTQAAEPSPTPAGPTVVPPAPVSVQVVGPPPHPLQFIRDMLGSVLSPLLTAGIVTIFVIFILVQREDLRDRLIRLAGEERLDVTTRALDDTARRISRYLLMMAMINASFGSLTALGLWLIGLPNALLWGLLAGALRFIPYLGIWIAMALPIALSLAVFPTGWLAPVAVVVLFLVLELLVANVIEPLVYGGSTGISPLAVLVAAIFWAWLWGPVGLLLSTPLTVCLVVLGKYAPALSFLNVLLGDQPVLDPFVRFYQRLLAGDQEDAEDLAEEYLANESLVKVYDQVIVPALHLAELDRHRGRLENDRLAAIYQAVREIIEDLQERKRETPASQAAADDGTTNPAAAVSSPPAPAILVLCLPARDEADEIVARMLAGVLSETGIDCRCLSVNMLVSEMLDEVAASDAKIACISAVPPEAMAKTRYLCKRLKARLPRVKLVVGFWDTQADPTRVRMRLSSAGVDHIVTDFAGVLQIVRPSQAGRTVSAP